jgi:uncharacterized protein YndB with AHSA1/START domain
MTQLRLSEHFEAPIDRVFDLIADVPRYPEWNASYTEIKEVTGPVAQVGTKIHAVMKLLGRPMAGWSEVVEVDRPRLIKFVGTGPEDGKLTVTYRLTPVGTGTDVESEFDYELPAGLFGQIADKLFLENAIKRDLRHSIENFKALVEMMVPVAI